MHRVLAMILAGGMGDRLSVLAGERAKPAVPFGGTYRIIDFALSNCANSGINKVAVLAQYAPRSLAEHLGDGRHWGFDHIAGKGLTLLQPYMTRTSRDWYEGSADAVYHNLGFVNKQRVKQILVLPGDHIYTMKYDQMVAFHRHHKADITVGIVKVPRKEASRFGIVTLGDNHEVTSFHEKPSEPKGTLASMGIYIFNKNTLLDCLEDDAQREGSRHDFGGDVIPSCLSKYRVIGYRFNGYWRDVGTVESYWQTNMDLIRNVPPLNLYDPDTEIRTSLHGDAPTKLGPKTTVKRSLISNGATIDGTVRNSIVSPHVYIEEKAVVDGSIILSGTRLGQGARVYHCVVDKDVWIGPGAQIGWGDDNAPNKDETDILNTGITVVGKGVSIPPGTKIGRNCRIACWVTEADFESDFVPSGTTVERKSKD